MPQPYKLLVAHDGSPCSDTMIEELGSAGLPEEVEVLVLSIAERWLPPPSVYEVATSPPEKRGLEFAAETASRVANELQTRYPGWRIGHEALSGSPARVIVHRSKEWGAQLIALGSLGHGALERILIGSVSQKVANEAPCSVRISRGRGQSDGIRLLLAYDGLPGAERAANAVAARVWPKDTEVRIVAAVGYGNSPVGEYHLPSDQDRVDALLAPTRHVLKQEGLTVSVTAQEADPKQLLVDEAIRLDARCIFAGDNDHTILDKVLLGTVSNALIARAPCSVEVVR